MPARQEVPAQCDASRINGGRNFFYTFIFMRRNYHGKAFG